LANEHTMFKLRIVLWRLVVSMTLFLTVVLAVRVSPIILVPGLVVCYLLQGYVQRLMTRCPKCHELLGRWRKMTWAQRSMAAQWWIPEKPAAKCDRCGAVID